MKVRLKADRHIGKAAQVDEIRFCSLGVQDERVFGQPRYIGVGVEEYLGLTAMAEVGILMDVGGGMDSARFVARLLKAFP